MFSGYKEKPTTGKGIGYQLNTSHLHLRGWSNKTKGIEKKRYQRIDILVQLSRPTGASCHNEADPSSHTPSA